MNDNTMHLQGWAKLMQPTARRAPTKKELAEKAKRAAEFERRAAEAIEWMNSRS